MKRSPSITSKLPALATLAVIVAIWLGASEGGLVPEFMLPSPAQVWDALVTDFPTLMANAAVTLQEAAYGLAIGIAVALLGPEDGPEQTSFKGDRTYYPPEDTLVYYLGVDMMDGVWLVISQEDGVVTGCATGMT